MYVTNYASDTVSSIDTSTNLVVDTVPVKTLPLGIAYDPVHGYIYVANAYYDSVSVISTTSSIQPPPNNDNNATTLGGFGGTGGSAGIGGHSGSAASTGGNGGSGNSRHTGSINNL